MKENYISYDYISVNVRSDLEPLYVDCYENFGWNHINKGKEDYYINADIKQKVLNLKFKRDRNISGKEQLDKLQKEFEKELENLENIEKKPENTGTMFSLIVAFIGAIFIAISMLFAFRESNVNLFISIPTGLIGIVLWIMPIKIYKTTIEKEKNGEKYKKMIENQTDKIHSICKKAREILIENNE